MIVITITVVVHTVVWGWLPDICLWEPWLSLNVSGNNYLFEYAGHYTSFWKTQGLEIGCFLILSPEVGNRTSVQTAVQENWKDGQYSK
jgi:hypothetical protein